MSNIFFSYSKTDRIVAEMLADALRNEGWSAWWDCHIKLGVRFREVIANELAAAKCVIVVWSKTSASSDGVLVEAAEARRRGILAPVQISDNTVPLGYRESQTSDLSVWQGSSDSLLGYTMQY